MKESVEAGHPLVVHAFVPLCDNENQGIVPTSPSLGDGMNLRTNLYWATSYGMRKYFEKHSEWKMTNVQSAVDSNVLERVFFERKYGDKMVVLICDAYRGDRMKECLEDYLASMAGERGCAMVYDSIKIGSYSCADLLVFNGHNGLMDTQPIVPDKVDSTYRDAVSISCFSRSYFLPYYERLGAYPVAVTTNLLYPGAQVVDEVIKEWVKGAAFPDGKQAAAMGYHLMKPKHSVTTCRRMFATGWE